MRRSIRAPLGLAFAVLAAISLAACAGDEGGGSAASPAQRMERPADPAAVGQRVTQASAPADAVTTRTVAMTAEAAFEQGQGVFELQKNFAGEGVILFNHQLVEDDGPGIGSANQWLNKAQQSPVAEISGQERLKKILSVADPRAAVSRLFITPGMKVEVNGVPVQTSPGAEYPMIPDSLLKKGNNQIVLSPPEGGKSEVKVARREDIVRNDPSREGAPPRSFKSEDGGKTWQAIDGELMIRLHLVQYRKEGSMISPVIDLRRSNEAAMLPDVAAESLRVWAEADTPGGTDVRLFEREGAAPLADDQTWGAWKPADKAIAPSQRYMQWKVALRTNNPLATPVLKAVRVEIRQHAMPLPAWAAGLKMTGQQNPEYRYTSMPFAYEDYKNPQLLALRSKYKLDEVVAAGKTEFEKMEMLRNWVSHQWKYHPPEEYYPNWDADDILSHHTGFCVQYAITYMQCCLAMGWQARFVFGFQPGIGSGHEINEVWSNEYGKWVLMDANGNRHHVDPKTGVPLSMLEVHDRMIAAFYPGVTGEVEISERSKAPVASPDIGNCHGLEMTAGAIDLTPKSWPPYYKWFYMHWVPRNNFYSQKYPVPLIQGWNWDWTGYWTWNDGRLDPRWKYDKMTGRVSDLYWTINEVRWALDAAADRPDTLHVQMATVTPGFETYLVSTDGGKEWQPAGSVYAWKLSPGKNRLEMRARNIDGVLGPVSFAEITR